MKPRSNSTSSPQESGDNNPSRSRSLIMSLLASVVALSACRNNDENPNQSVQLAQAPVETNSVSEEIIDSKKQNEPESPKMMQISDSMRDPEWMKGMKLPELSYDQFAPHPEKPKISQEFYDRFDLELGLLLKRTVDLDQQGDKSSIFGLDQVRRTNVFSWEVGKLAADTLPQRAGIRPFILALEALLYDNKYIVVQNSRYFLFKTMPDGVAYSKLEGEEVVKTPVHILYDPLPLSSNELPTPVSPRFVPLISSIYHEENTHLGDLASAMGHEAAHVAVNQRFGACADKEVEGVILNMGEWRGNSVNYSYLKANETFAFGTQLLQATEEELSETAAGMIFLSKPQYKMALDIFQWEYKKAFGLPFDQSMHYRKDLEQIMATVPPKILRHIGLRVQKAGWHLLKEMEKRGVCGAG